MLDAPARFRPPRGRREFFMRIFLAALLGAIAMFIWSAIAHMMLPLGEAGLRDLPNDSVLKALQNELGDQPGLYPASVRELKIAKPHRCAASYSLAFSA